MSLSTVDIMNKRKNRFPVKYINKPTDNQKEIDRKRGIFETIFIFS